MRHVTVFLILALCAGRMLPLPLCSCAADKTSAHAALANTHDGHDSHDMSAAASVHDQGVPAGDRCGDVCKTLCAAQSCCRLTPGSPQIAFFPASTRAVMPDDDTTSSLSFADLFRPPRSLA